MASASPLDRQGSTPGVPAPNEGSIIKIPSILPRERVFPIQIGGELFKLSGASISSDAPSYFSQYFLCQIKQAEGRGEDIGSAIRTLYIDRDPVTFRDIALHLQGYHVKPKDGTHFVRLFADAQFYSLPKLISQLNEESIFISIGHREFQIPRDVLTDPANSPNYFSLGFALFFGQPEELFPGLDREGLLRPPSILPPAVPNRNGDTFADLLHLLRGYPVNIRDEVHRQELLRDARYFHFKGLEQRLIPHSLTYNPVRKRNEIVIRLENLQKSGVGIGPPEVEDVGTPTTVRPVNYARPYIDDKTSELILEIGAHETKIHFSASGPRAEFFNDTRARVARLLEVIATKLNLPPTTQPLGLLMATGGAGSQPATPGHTPLSDELVRVVFESESSIALNGVEYDSDLFLLSPADGMTPEVTAETVLAAADEQPDANPSAPRKRKRTTYNNGTYDEAAAAAAQSATRPVTGSSWAVSVGQWRLRIQESRDGKRDIECVFVCVKLDAVSSERGRNRARGFLSV